MFFIDDNTLDYLRLTGRDDAQVALVETYAKTAGFWADDLAHAQYERTLHFDLSTVVRNMAGPSNPHRRLPVSGAAERGIADEAKLDAARGEEARGLIPDGAVIIAAITSCTNTSNPRNVIAAGAAGAQRQRARADPQAVGEELAGARLEGGAAVPGGSQAAARAGTAGLRHRRLRLHHLQRHERRAGPGHPEGSDRARPVRHRGAVRQPQLRRPHPSVCEAGVPGLAAAGDRLCHRRHRALRHREGRAGHRSRWQRGAAQGHLAVRCRDRRGRRGQRQAGAVPPGVRPDVRAARARPAGQAAVRLAPAEHLHPLPALLGRRAGRRTHACRHAPAGGAGRQHHHRPPVAVQRDPAPPAPPANTWRRWACRKRTSIPTPPTAATT